MKKIVSVLLLLALVFGAVYAQSVSLNYRTQAELFNYNAKTGALNLLDNDAYGAAQDSLTFNLAGKTAGVKLAIQPTLSRIADKQYVSTDAFFVTLPNAEDPKKNDNAVDLGSDANLFLRLNSYEGWVKFGDLKIGGGYWRDGMFRANRVTTDAGNWGGKDFEVNKIGIINGALGKGIDSVVNTNNAGKGQATYVEYAPKFGDSTVFVRAAVVTTAENSTKTTDDFDGDDSNAFTNKNQFGAILAYNLKNTVDVEFVARFFSETQRAFGFYVQPLMVKGLNVTIGGAAAFDKAKANTEMGFDLRARYAVDKKLSITTMHNFSLDGAPVENKDPKKEQKHALWNMVSAKYIINDLATVQLTVNHTNADISKPDTVKSMIRITPGLVLTAAENCTITTGVAVQMQDDETILSMPMVLRVKM